MYQVVLVSFDQWMSPRAKCSEHACLLIERNGRRAFMDSTSYIYIKTLISKLRPRRLYSESYLHPLLCCAVAIVYSALISENTGASHVAIHMMHHNKTTERGWRHEQLSVD